MALAEAAEACLLAFQAWLLALAITALACVKVAIAAYHALLGLPGVQLIGRLAQVRPGSGKAVPSAACEAGCAPCLGRKAPRINALRVVEARPTGFGAWRVNSLPAAVARRRSFPAARHSGLGAGIAGPPNQPLQHRCSGPPCRCTFSCRAACRTRGTCGRRTAAAAAPLQRLAAHQQQRAGAHS